MALITAHELARKLLEGPDLPVLSTAAGGDEYGWAAAMPSEPYRVRLDDWELRHGKVNSGDDVKFIIIEDNEVVNLPSERAPFKAILL